MMSTTYTPKYMVACPVVTPHIQETIERLRNKLIGKMRGGILFPSFDHVTFGQPFMTSYQEATRINLSVEMAALRLSMREHIFTLGEVKFFKGETVDTLYIEVLADEDVVDFLKKMRNAFFSFDNITVLGPRLDGGEPKLHITLFQGKHLARKSKRLLRDIGEYNESVRLMNKEEKERLVVFETFIPALYAKYCVSGWQLLGRDPRESP